MRICMKNVSCKTHFACIFALHHLFFQFFAKMCSPPRVGSTFLKNDFEHVLSKTWLFRPPNGFKMINFCKFCLLLSLCCSFASLCARSVSPSKTACGSTPLQFSPPSPVCENDCLHKNSTCYCLSAFRALQTLFFQKFVIFCKICSPLSVGSTFWKTHVSKVAKWPYKCQLRITLGCIFPLDPLPPGPHPRVPMLLLHESWQHFSLKPVLHS